MFDTQGTAPRYRTRTTEWSIFAEDRLKLTPQLSLVGGIRHEQDKVRRRTIVRNAQGQETGSVNAFPGGRKSRTLTHTTWRVGAVYQPVPTLSLYGQYSTGVDPLGTLASFTTDATQFFFTNATGEQLEAGVKLSFLDGRGAATLAGYRIVKRNLVAQRTPSSPIEQIGQRSARGIEASVSVNLSGRLAISANATMLDADYDDFISGGRAFTGNTPPNVPEAAANLAVRWNAGRKIQMRAEFRYVGKSYSDNANRYRIPAYAVTDGAISYAISDRFAIDMRVYNILDKVYATNAYNDEQWLLGRPRSLDVMLRARF